MEANFLVHSVVEQLNVVLFLEIFRDSRMINSYCAAFAKRNTRSNSGFATCFTTFLGKLLEPHILQYILMHNMSFPLTSFTVVFATLTY
ncbi:hypothetical protein C487_07552 [Natrinema pallidum DSM 3751]|uniref:Uncharacterized protein n=1 Tax=Natrinema pallidum DSM 3751 TaxID=1227495 RepID=L9YX49_9EURY|nr:hypothetical protein C487_07552 [Natrinema pallidum DSM 3751]